MAPRRSGYGAFGAPGAEATADLGRSTDDRTPLFGDVMNSSDPQGRASPKSSRGWYSKAIVAGLAVTAFSAAFSVTKSAYNARIGGGSGVEEVPFEAAAIAAATEQQSSAGNRAHNVNLDEFSTGAAAAVQQDRPREQASATGSAASATIAKPAPELDVTDSELTFVAMNDYTRRGDVVGVGYPWLAGKILIEPYRETSLIVVSPVEGMSYSWVVMEHDGKAGQRLFGKYAGPEVVVVLPSNPQYTIILEEYREDSDGDGIVLSRRTETEIFCKYVRREIRSLLDAERQEMFDTMKTLWDVKTADGVKIYGENYMDVWDIDKFHQVGASDIDCDHLHDGLGFGITHSMVTLMFEFSMQLVNPKITLPYWDFTIEAAVVDTQFDGDYTRLREASNLWNSDWFGSVDESDWQVKDGRWGNMKVPVIEDGTKRDIMGTDVFGRMRSPWNVNDREFLVRGLGEMCGISSTTFYAWPTCETHYEAQELYTSYYGYTWHSQYQPHGPVHVWIGGNIDCKKAMDETVEIIGEEYRTTVTGYSFIMRKGLFRDHLWKCQGVATKDTSAMEVMQTGQCGCLDMNLEEGDDYLYIYDLFDNGAYDFPEFSEAEKRKLAILYCSGVVGIGESSQSSSPLDPTFWSLHPTMERLLSFKLLAGGFDDWSWPDSPGPWVGMDGVEYDVTLSVQADECYGHLGSDVFPYDILKDILNPVFNFNGKVGHNQYTNRELVKFFDPRTNALPYIYDNFDWHHCAEQGWDFRDFYDPATGAPGLDPLAQGPNVGAKTGKKKVHGFEIFKKGQPKAPLYDSPRTAVKDS